MTSTHRRKFDEEQKRFIISEAGKRGVNKVLREYKLSYSVFYKWKQQYPGVAPDTLPAAQLLQQVRQLTRENDRLRKLVAALAAAIQVKVERQ